MSLAPGTRLGPYEIQALIGAGGMGEVYKARDPKLEREVAIKVLPPAFAEETERLRRFELEARATGSLNHPNILAVYDLGTHEGSPYLVMELLEGEALRTKLGGKALPAKKAVELALQMAHGLAAAHEKGIVHRDLKPENVFLTKDGRVKILDFGLAKQAFPRDGLADMATEAMEMGTAAGMILGTVGYMSPEQVRGEKVDARSDLFSFGVILWEMLGGERPFQGASAVETLNAILKEEPPELDPGLKVPPALERILHGCLVKEPAGRIHSAHDLAFALEGLSGQSAVESGIRPSATLHGWRGLLARHRWTFALGACLLAALGGLAWMLHREGQRLPEYSFQRLTFRRGFIDNARFGPDGRTIYYSAAWAGEPSRIFAQTDGALGTPLPDLPPGSLLAVSRTGELALTDAPIGKDFRFNPGSLLLARPGTGKPRPVAAEVTAADFAPDGKSLAVAFWSPAHMEARLEFPIGKAIFRANQPIDGVRVAPDGSHLALHMGAGEQGGLWLLRADGSGKARRLSALSGVDATTLAWNSESNGLFVGTRKEIQVFDLEGRLKGRLPTFGPVYVFDQDPRGRLLTGSSQARATVEYLDESGARKDLSWMDASDNGTITEDGRTMAFTEDLEGSRFLGGWTAFVRSTDGSPPVQVGKGTAYDLSADGKQVLLLTEDGKFMLQPVGPGSPVEVASPRPGIHFISGWIMSDGRVCWGEADDNGGGRTWVRAMDRAPEPFGPEGYSRILFNPRHGRAILTKGDHAYLWEAGKGEPRPLPLDPGTHLVAGWPDPRTLLVYSWEPGRCRIEQLDLATGQFRPYKDLTPTSPGGLLNSYVISCKGGKAWVVSYGWCTMDLQLGTPARQP